MSSPKPRAMIVEDEALIAMHLQEILEDTGLAVVALFRNAELALAGLKDAAPDVAVLDINLGNNATSMPVAEKLAEAGIPFLFLTGYGKSGAEGGFSDVPVLTKPVNDTELSTAIRGLLQG